MVEFKKRELENCNFVRTVLMLIIVLYHSILFFGGNWFTKDAVFTSKTLSFAASWLNSFHIYGFTLVSGYVFYFLKYEAGKYQKYIPFLKNKAKRLLIPYCFVVLVWVLPIQFSFLKYDIITIIKNFILAISPNQLWFLWMLFGVFAFFWPISNIVKTKRVLGFFVIFALFGIGTVARFILPDVFQILNALTYLPFFYFGFKIRQNSFKFIYKIPVLVWVLAHIMLFIAMKYLYSFDTALFKILNIGVAFAVRSVGAVASFVILQKFANFANWQQNKLFSVLQKNSMTIYLFHQQIIYFVIICFNGVLNPFVHSIVNFVTAIILSLLIAKLLSKFKITRFLIGEK